MAKKNETDKRKVKLGMNDVSDNVISALTSLNDIIFIGMTADQIIAAAETIKAECGGEANIDLDYSDDYGSDVNVSWSRLETDDEVKKRIAKSAKQRKSAAATRTAKKAQKILDDKTVLARLRKLYPND